MRLLSHPAELGALETRLGGLRPESFPLWGKMSAGGLICHLCDSYRFALGERPARHVSNFVTRTLVKWIALHTPLPWAKNIRTMPEIDQSIGGTCPGEFVSDRAELLLLIRRFVEPCESRPPHPIFGPMTEHEWQHWGWRHADHHLRQFGL